LVDLYLSASWQEMMEETEMNLVVEGVRDVRVMAVDVEFPSLRAGS